MNQTGVASTGSRRHAFRKRDAGTRDQSRTGLLSRSRASVTSSSRPSGLYGARGGSERVGGRARQLWEQQRLVAQVGAERLNFSRLRLIEIVVASNDGYW